MSWLLTATPTSNCGASGLALNCYLVTPKLINDGAVLKLRALLESYVPQWGVISAAIQPTIYVLEQLLKHSSPLLHTLTLIANEMLLGVLGP
jgi:hypothetical protein